jgi:hypothetical protein
MRIVVMKLKLYLDDERVEPIGWVRVSTAANAIAILQTGQVDELSLDHDLDFAVDTRDGEPDPPILTGYDVACWLEQQAAEGNWEVIPRVMKCHSDNPPGRERIIQALTNIQRWRE